MAHFSTSAWRVSAWSWISGRAAERARKGGADGAEDAREGVLVDGGEVVFSLMELEGREVDGEGAVGEVGGAGPAIGDGEEDRALAAFLERLGGGGLVAHGEADAGGEAAEGIGDRRLERGDVVEGEDPVVAGGGLEVADGDGDGGEDGRGVVDEGAEEAGGHGLAGAGRALQDEDGERAVGAEGGDEPSERAEPVGAGGEVEEGVEGVEGGG
jgi:hypothetical protein